MNKSDALGLLCVFDALSTLTLAAYATPRLAVGRTGQRFGILYCLGCTGLHVNSAYLYLGGHVPTIRDSYFVWRTLIVLGAAGFCLAMRHRLADRER